MPFAVLQPGNQPGQTMKFVRSLLKRNIRCKPGGPVPAAPRSSGFLQLQSVFLFAASRQLPFLPVGA